MVGKSRGKKKKKRKKAGKLITIPTPTIKQSCRENLLTSHLPNVESSICRWKKKRGKIQAFSLALYMKSYKKRKNKGGGGALGSVPKCMFYTSISCCFHCCFCCYYSDNVITAKNKRRRELNPTNGANIIQPQYESISLLQNCSGTFAIKLQLGKPNSYMFWKRTVCTICTVSKWDLLTMTWKPRI